MAALRALPANVAERAFVSGAFDAEIELRARSGDAADVVVARRPVVQQLVLLIEDLLEHRASEALSAGGPMGDECGPHRRGLDQHQNAGDLEQIRREVVLHSQHLIGVHRHRGRMAEVGVHQSDHRRDGGGGIMAQLLFSGDDVGDGIAVMARSLQPVLDGPLHGERPRSGLSHQGDAVRLK